MPAKINVRMYDANRLVFILYSLYYKYLLAD